MAERTRSGGGTIAAHCAELTAQLEALADLIEVAERRDDLMTLDSVEDLAEVQAALARLDALLRDRASPTRTARNRHVPSAAETIARVRGTSVQAAVAEATESMLLTSAQELELWMRGPRDVRQPEAAATAEEPVEG